MTYIVQNNEKILVWFDVCEGMPCVEIDDANYVRAEKILYNKNAHCICAVLYDGLFLIGEVPDIYRSEFLQSKTVTLKSLLPCGTAVQMQVAVGHFSDDHICDAKKEEAFDLLPVFAAAGHAMHGFTVKS